MQSRNPVASGRLQIHGSRTRFENYWMSTTESQAGKSMNLALNKLILSAMAAIVFFLVINMFEAETLIYIMNSAFAGAMVAILVAYWRLVWNALAGIRPYDRVRQMTLGFFLCWVAYCISVFTSIYFRSADLSGAATTSIWTVMGRYIAIFAAVLQVTAPDFGLGIFHGRDRKTLWTGLTLGTVFGVLVFFAQSESVLKPLVNAMHPINLALLAIAS